MRNNPAGHLKSGRLGLCSLLVVSLAIGTTLLPCASLAATYQWRGTTSSAWTTTNNWNPTAGTVTGGPAPTNGNFIHRLNVTNTPSIGNECVYDASLGTTIFGATGVRGLVVGSTGPGNFRITGGVFATTNANAAAPDVISSSSSTTQATITNDGGVYLSRVLQLGLNNPNHGSLTLNGGATIVSNLQYNFQGGNATVNLNGGTLTASWINRGTTTPANSTNLFNFNGGTLVAGASSSTFMAVLNTNEWSGANVRDGGAKIDTAGFNIGIAQSLRHSSIGGDAVVDGGLTKSGLGTLTLNGTNTYTGGTVVNQGTLAMRLPSSSSSLTLASGVTNNITVNGSAWNLDSAALTNAVIGLNYGSFNGDTNAAITVTNLVMAGTVTFNISGTGIPATNITLFSYQSGAHAGTFALGLLPPGTVATLVDDGSNVVMQVTTASVQSLIWSVGDGNWQTNGAANWNAGTATYLEYPSDNNDLVIFNDTASGPVNVGSTVKPSSVTVDVTTSSYTFSGANPISGATGISKLGGSTLTLSQSNDFTGVVTVNDGTVFVNHANALGATSGGTVVTGPASTLELGTIGGTGIGVTNETITISGSGVGGVLGALRGMATVSGENVWAGPVGAAANASRIGIENNGNLTIAGSITDNGANFDVVFRSASGGTITISGSSNTWGGLSSLLGTDTTSINRLGLNNALPTNAIIGVGNCTFDLNGYNQTGAGLIKAFSSAVDANCIVANNGASLSVLTLNPAVSNAFPGSINDGLSQVALVKSGSGMQVLSGVSGYTGSTTVSGGELRINGILASTNVTVGSGARLSGVGTISGPITLGSGATLAPGAASIGRMTNSNTLTLDAGSTVHCRVSGFSTNADMVDVTTVAYAGTLSVSNLSATPIHVGQVFKLFNAGVQSGNFINAASVTIASGGGGAFNPATGELTVTSVPAAPTLNFNQGGGSLQFSWTTGNGIFHLQAQTNGLGVGINTNWGNYPGGTTSPVTVPIDAAQETVFFRLVAP